MLSEGRKQFWVGEYLTQSFMDTDIKVTRVEPNGPVKIEADLGGRTITIELDDKNAVELAVSIFSLCKQRVGFLYNKES